MADKNAKIHVPPKGTRGARAIEVVGNLMRPLADREVARYQKLPGPEAGNFMGFPFQVLTTVGAESGKQRNVGPETLLTNANSRLRAGSVAPDAS